MRYGYWLPVFGGWLRNVDDEGMAPSSIMTTVWIFSLRCVVHNNVLDS